MASSIGSKTVHRHSPVTHSFSTSALPDHPRDDNDLPPAKRPRLSPTDSPRLPQSPTLQTTHNSAQTAMTNGQRGSQMESAAKSNRPSGMGPPQKPATQVVGREPDFQQSTDVLTGIVNIEEEEAAMRSQVRASGITNGFPGSFGDSDSFNESDPSQVQRIAAQSQRNKETAAERIEAEFLSEHMNSPFIRGGVTFHRLTNESAKNMLKTPRARRRDEVNVNLPDGFIGTLAAKDDKILGTVSCLSLASKDKVRNLLEMAKMVAAARQKSSDGVVPDDFASISRGDDGSGPQPPPPGKPTTYNNSMVTKIRSIMEAKAAKEAQRKLNRAHRLASAMAANPSGISQTPTTVTTPEVPTNEAATPTTPGLVAPEPAKVAPSMKRKAGDKLTQAEEDKARKDANQTAATMMGKKKSKYSWMNPGASSSGSSTPRPFGGTKGSRNNSGKGSTGTSGRGGAKDDEPPRKRKFGEFREDGKMGKGVQLRDWVMVMEMDDKNPKALVRACSMLK